MWQKGYYAKYLNCSLCIMFKLKNSGYLVQVGVSWLSKILNVSMQIVLIPLIFKYLGVGDFALYSFMLGLSAWFNLSDLSTGVVLQNSIIKARAKDKYSGNGLLLNSFYFYILLIGIFSLISIGIYPLIYKYFIYKIILHNTPNVVWTWCIFCVLYLASTLFQQNTTKVYYALGKGFQINGFNLLGSLTGYILLFMVFTFSQFHSLILILSLGILPNLVINVFLYYQLIDKQDKFVKTEFIIFIKSITYEARHFLLFAILGSLVLQLDYLLIAHYLSTNDIIQYNWYTKIFGSVYALFSILLGNYYANCAHQIYANEPGKATRGILIQFAIGLSLIICCVVFLLLTKNMLISYFFHGQVYLSGSVALVYGAYFILRAWTEVWSIPLFSLNQGRSLIGFVLAQAVISLPLQVILIKRFGLVGMLVGLALSFLLTVCWLYPYKVLSHFRRQNGFIGTKHATKQ